MSYKEKIIFSFVVLTITIVIATAVSLIMVSPRSSQSTLIPNPGITPKVISSSVPKSQTTQTVSPNLSAMSKEDSLPR